MAGLDIAFWTLAVIGVASALTVVLLRNVFRAALSLVLCFLAVAGIYVSLSADFLAAVQVLIYVGAISVLIILAIMLTRDVQRGSLSNKFRIPAFFVAILFLGAVGFAVCNTPWQIAGIAPQEPTTSALAGKLFGEGGFVLPLEITPVLLLAAILGAIILVREK
ncbi:MAG: NADH-quinone oxidoreductase subunit L [Chloroflexi bacterium CG_4_10_14_0_8_um_filter_46_9]|nr:MAG: NADH-quinone oxidoreductase subunit L [Dehalococcoidia bacterium CG2_30_46_19]PIW40712.1 MAG: NADH-quinone oxidoreductase subunit L [Chloroflexi bacterium CG15_BIG_FIL_POST_REV_8_21_14_020_46_15]PIZ27258.1 MAG: NADH-quinone oxidoreductase subunit L [Chloroflexi bacterium CG_4_10_14_0_8_um_filter_46_9]